MLLRSERLDTNPSATAEREMTPTKVLSFKSNQRPEIKLRKIRMTKETILIKVSQRASQDLVRTTTDLLKTARENFR